MAEKKAQDTQLAVADRQFELTQAGQDAKAFETLQRKGMMYAQSDIVPDTYRNKPGNAIIALEMAQRMNALPLMIMQNLYIVHGQPAFSSKFLIACINSSRRFSPLRYEFKGEEGKPEYGCRVYAYKAGDKEKKEPLYGDWITMQMAESEGWTKKNGSKWRTMPNQMLRYRAAAFWQRVYCPEISMGLMTAEEAEDIEYAEYTEIPSEQPKQEDVADALSKAEQAMKEAEAESPEVDTETGEILFPGV